VSARLELAASLEQIAEVEGTTVAAIHMCLPCALRKLRHEGLLITCRELAAELNRNRSRREIVE
jgi:hypothetical protein